MPHAARTSRIHDREIARLAIPALGALIAEPLYVLADTAVVGHIGTVELAGLAVASSALLATYTIFIFLAYGTTAAVSRLLGAGRDDEAAHQAVQGLWLAAVIGVAVAVGIIGAATPLVEVLGASGAVADQAEIYLRISAFGIPAQLLTFAGTGYLRGQQNTAIPLVVAIVAAGFNLVLELILINGVGYGIGASALSTVVAQTGTALAYLWFVGGDARRRRVRLAPHWSTIARLGRVGRDLLIRTTAIRGTLTLTTAVAARIGTADVAAHEIALAVGSLLALALDALAIAGQSLVGRSLGAGDAATARAVGRRMVQLGAGFGLGVGVLVLAGRPFIPTLFSPDPDVVTLAAFLLLFVAVLQPINGVIFVLDGILIGAGDMTYLAWAMVASAAAAVPVALSVLVFDLGIGWVWVAIVVLMTARAVTLVARWRGDAWMVLGAET